MSCRVSAVTHGVALLFVVKKMGSNKLCYNVTNVTNLWTPLGVSTTFVTFVTSPLNGSGLRDDPIPPVTYCCHLLRTRELEDAYACLNDNLADWLTLLA